MWGSTYLVCANTILLSITLLLLHTAIQKTKRRETLMKGNLEILSKTAHKLGENICKLLGFAGAHSDGKESASNSVSKETRVQSLGQEDPLEKGMATHSRILSLENSMERGARWSKRSQRVRHN